MRILCIAFVTLTTASWTLAGYINAFNQPFAFYCPKNKIISYISSVHDNYYEDRQWEIHCRTVKATSSCDNSVGYENKFDDPLFFLCPGYKVLTGIESYYDDHYEDRRFKFQCCDASENKPINCYTTSNMNEWDGKLTMLVPEDQAIFGVFSHHNNHFEDRQFSFRLCTL